VKYLVSGYIGYGNVGDEVILRQIVRDVTALDPAAEFAVLSGDPAATRREHGVHAYPRAHPSGVLRGLGWCDVLISGGGTLLQDVTSPRPPVYYGGITMLARLLRKPYIVYAQGLGPLTRPLSRAIATATLDHADVVCLRDAESVALARELGVDRDIDVVSDPAFGMEHVPGEHAPGTRPRIVVALRDWARSEEVADTVSAALSSMAATVDVTIVVMQPRDREIAVRVHDALGGQALIVDCDQPISARVSAIQSADLTLGMRLHALIIAAAATRRIVALSYDPKVDALAASLGAPVFRIDDSRLSASALAVTLEAQLREHSIGYERRVAELRSYAARPAKATVRLAKSQARRP